MHRGRWVALLWVLVVMPACEPPPPERQLAAIPRPVLSQADEEVRRRLEEARAALDAQLDDRSATDNELAEAFGRLGMLYQAYDQLESARACFVNATDLNDREFRWIYYLGIIQEELGEEELAVDSLERALRQRPDELPALIRLGYLAANLNRYDRAEELLRRALELDAESPAALAGMGRLALVGEDYQGAISLFDAARRADPQASQLNHLLGLAYRGMGLTDRAAAFLARRGEIPPRNADPWLDEVHALGIGVVDHINRGAALMREGNPEAARDAFATAARLDPREPSAHVNLGHSLAQLGDLDGARRHFEEALRLDPEHASAMYNLGTIWASGGNDLNAVEYYEAALAINPELVPARFNLANSLRRLERFEASVPHYRRVVESDPGHIIGRIGEALALIRLHRYAEARDRLEEGLAALPAERDLRRALARLLAAAPDDAVRDGRRAVDVAGPLAAEDAVFDDVVTLAMVAAEAGDFPTAVRLQLQAIEAAGAVRLAERAPDEMAELQRNLARYQRNEPCRRPWLDDGAVLSPRPVRPASG